MNITLTILTGLCISVMIFFNGTLDGYIGTVPSMIIIHLTGLLLSIFISLKKSIPSSDYKTSRWNLLAGLLGLGVLPLMNAIFSIGGVVLSLIGTLAGQIIMAFIIELYSIKSFKALKLKFVSIILVVFGAGYIGISNNISFLWIIISWIPGMLLFIQSLMNSKNIKTYGLNKTVLFHYGTALIVLIPLYLIKNSFNYQDLSQLITVPGIFLFGGGLLSIFAISMGSYLLLKVKPITYVLVIYLGQIIGAMSIDSFLGLTMSTDKIIGLFLIVNGLIIGEVKFRQRVIINQ